MEYCQRRCYFDKRHTSRIIITNIQGGKNKEKKISSAEKTFFFIRYYNTGQCNTIICGGRHTLTIRLKQFHIDF